MHFPRPDSHTARGVHPTALPSRFDIVMLIGVVKPPQSVRWPLAAEVSDRPGEAADEITHPSVFALRCIKLKPIHGANIQILAVASG
jgi:hypothetical protein